LTTNTYPVAVEPSRREVEYPDGIELTFRRQTFTIPAELPEAVLDPFFADNFDQDLVAFVGAILNVRGGDMDAKDEKVGAAVMSQLMSRPTLPRTLRNAIHAAYRVLFGDDGYERLIATKPSVVDLYWRLPRALADEYGVGLGEASTPAGQPETGGQTSNPTLPATTPESTPEPSGGIPATPDSSVPAVSTG